MTRVGATLRRSLSYSSFVDITGPDVALLRWTKEYADFDGDLTPEQVEAIWARIESTDDVDQEKRANLRALMAEVRDAEVPASLEDALALVAVMQVTIVDALGYWLGE